MRQLHRIVLRRLPGPFFGWLGTLVFLLLMQFLIRWLPELAGKGLPLGAIVELVVYNLAYMLVLAVPMATLLATMMAFASLAEAQAYAVVKSAGISVAQLAWPALVVGLVVTGGMVYFNNVVLPDANFQARALWRDIRSKEPGFELRPGVFYTGVEGYSILVGSRPPASDSLFDVTIYDYSDGPREQATIKAKRGTLHPDDDGLAIVLTLLDGEMHRPRPARTHDEAPRYERLVFARQTLRLDVSDFVFERSSPRERGRSDRTMRTTAMLAAIDSLEAEQRVQREALLAYVRKQAALPAPRDAGAPPLATRPLGTPPGADDAAESNAPKGVAAEGVAAEGVAAKGSGSKGHDAAAEAQPAAKDGSPAARLSAEPRRRLRERFGGASAGAQAPRPAPPRPGAAEGASGDAKEDPTGAKAAPALPVEPVLRGLSLGAQRDAFSEAVREARRVQGYLRSEGRTYVWRTERISRYLVEIYKKFSMALACLVFVFIGAPLGLSLSRGGLGAIAGYALGIFLFYWVTLVQGEKLADRGLLPPWLGMWIANAIMVVVAAWLIVYVVFDLGATPPLRHRLRAWWRSKHAASARRDKRAA